MPTTTIRQPLPVIIQHEPHQPNAADVEMQDRSAQVLRKIDAVEHQLLELAEPIVNDAKLTTLGFVRAAALSLDKPTVDTRDLFFSPFPEARTEELCDGIVNMYVEGDAEYLDYCARKHHSVSCPYYLYLRVRGLLSGAKYTRLVKWKATDSVCNKVPQHQKPNAYNGYYKHPAIYARPGVSDIPVWRMAEASFVHGQPHVRCIIADSTIARGADVLRSELVCALQLVQHQMKCSHYDGQVVPVLVFSIGHTNVGRITQVHVDWTTGKIILRQTRLLNFVPASGVERDRSIEDWFELTYLIRWLEATPTGKTQMATQAGVRG